MAAQLNVPLRAEFDEGVFPSETLVLSATVVEEINRPTEITIDVACDRPLTLPDTIGSKATLVYDNDVVTNRSYRGSIATVEDLGLRDKYFTYRVQVRSWIWFLDLTSDCKVYQGLSVTDIFKETVADHGFDGDYALELTGSYPPRKYVVQYRETDFDFLHRLLEEEGLYYFFPGDDPLGKMVLTDNLSKFADADGFYGSNKTVGKGIVFEPPNHSAFFDHVFEWGRAGRATAKKVSIRDFDFKKTNTQLSEAKIGGNSAKSNPDMERYDYPGKFWTAERGGALADVRVLSETALHDVVHGRSNAIAFSPGIRFEFTQHPNAEEDGEYCVTRTTHHFAQTELEPGRFGGLIDPEAAAHVVAFEAVPATTTYRAPQITPRPLIPGIQTATVVGKSGEEIHTDKHGRVRIQFHWDRDGKKDEKSSCWVRCMMPWSGAGWGMMQIPRIGQEVVVQFEEGDPDRPLIVGMLYNDVKQPPYGLPDNKTKSGLKTNSTKGGGGFHELMFEDKKGGELVRFQSERDYKQIIKNNAEIEIGLAHEDKGDLTQTIFRHKTETLETGDMTFTVKKGSEYRDIAQDQKEKIGGSSTEEVGTTSDIDIGTALTITAGTKIELKVGGSSIVIDPKGVTIKGPMLTVDGKMTEVKGAAVLILKGGMTMIN